MCEENGEACSSIRLGQSCVAALKGLGEGTCRSQLERCRTKKPALYSISTFLAMLLALKTMPFATALLSAHLETEAGRTSFPTSSIWHRLLFVGWYYHNFKFSEFRRLQESGPVGHRLRSELVSFEVTWWYAPITAFRVSSTLPFV